VCFHIIRSKWKYPSKENTSEILGIHLNYNRFFILHRMFFRKIQFNLWARTNVLVTVCFAKSIQDKMDRIEKDSSLTTLYIKRARNWTFLWTKLCFDDVDVSFVTQYGWNPLRVFFSWFRMTIMLGIIIDELRDKFISFLKNSYWNNRPRDKLEYRKSGSCYRAETFFCGDLYLGLMPGV